jgi:hypothetical protein
LVVQMLLCGVLVTSAVAKVIQPDAARRGVTDLGVPARHAPVALCAVVALELITGVGLVTPLHRTAGAAVVVLMLGFSAILSFNLAKGRRPVCRCFGSLSDRPVSLTDVGRNLVMAALGVLVWLGPSTWTPSVPLMIGLAAVCAICLLGAVLVAVLRQQGRLMARIEALERAASLGGPGSGAVPTLPFTPSPGPVSDVDGLSWTLPALAADDGAVLLFIDRDCPTCHASLPGLLSVPTPRRRVVVSRQRAEWSGVQDGVRVLLDPAGALADAVGVSVVPSMVLLERDGSVTTRTAVGPDRIRAALDADRARMVSTGTPEAIGS